MTQPQHSAHPAQPILLSPLRAALGRLYSLPGHQRFHGVIDDAAVHTFLVDVQSRNVRRKRQSKMQSLRDGGDADNNISNANPANAADSASGEDPGSIWLACLCLLTLPNAHSAERLFAAQTILGRLRRARMSEAVDVEVEDLSIACNGVRYDVMSKYAGWVSSFHPLLQSAAARCQQQQQPISADRYLSLEQEERYKGQMTVYLLAACLCLASASGGEGKHEVMAGSGPLLSTLGSALSIAALRLRYPPPATGSRSKSGSFPHTMNTMLADPDMPPLVTMVGQSVTVSADEAESLLGCGRHVSHRAICSAIASLPDSILGVPGGARSRISVDPRSIRAAAEELRSAEGFGLMASHLESRAPTVAEGTEAVVHAPILEVCQSWASYLPLPVEFIEHTITLAATYIGMSHHSHGIDIAKKLALGYLIAIFEGAAKTVEEIIATRLGLGAGSAPQLNRKRQSSKSKKRQKERLDEAIQSDRGKDGEEGILEEAERELLQRLHGSCRAAILALGELKGAVLRELSSSDGGEGGGGEGPVGCLAACTSSCLPFLIRGDTAQLSHSDSLLLFRSTSEVLLHIASSRSPIVRALSYSPIFAIHGGLVQAWSATCNKSVNLQSSDVQQAAIDVVYRCTMTLATECKYPPGYFAELADDNDEDLEIERNDVRDVIRTVSGSEDSTPNGASLLILEKILHACADAAITDDANLPPETVVHTLSSLAKPMNKIASIVSSGQSDQVYHSLLTNALRILADISEAIIRAFHSSVSQNDVFPVSRLQCLAAASFAPSLRDIAAMSSSVDDALRQTFPRTLPLLVKASAISVSKIPELAASSSLDRTQYDIRGAMRGPGGEDHVGCIALFRLAHESKELCHLMTVTYDGEGASPKLILDLCALHEQLKQDELARGAGIFHGRGVTPKTRRILLQAISRLGVVAIENASNSGQTGGHIETISTKLQELFHTPLQIILQTRGAQATKAGTLYQVCEAVFDLSSFSPHVVSSLFSPVEHQNNPNLREAVEYIVELVVSGYELVNTSGDSPDDTLIQWGRLRGSLFSLLRVCRNPGLPVLALQVVAAINQAECEAIATQCSCGPDSPSVMFNDNVIGEEALSAGAFVAIVHETLVGINKQRDGSALSEQEAKKYTDDCVLLLHRSKDLLRVLMHPCPEATGHVDARPSLGEAWHFAVAAAIMSYSKSGAPASSIFGNTVFTELLGETCATAIQMLYFRDIEKGASSSFGMSVDGAQTLATIDFLAAALSLGPETLSLIYQFGPHVMLDPAIMSALEASPSPAVHGGGALLGAALFRATSGCWPPWAIEGVPPIYSALFSGACRCNIDLFCEVMQAAGEIRLDNSPNAQYGAIRPGKKLAGRYFDQISAKTKEELTEQVRKSCQQNDASGWRRMKVVLKKVTGGKKKDTGFNQKPALTEWNCDRL